MFPVLAQIPALPSFYLPFIAGAAGLLSLLGVWKTRTAAPLAFAVGVAFLAWLWSRSAGVTLHSYGFFLVLGFFLSTWLACLEAKRRGYDPNIVLDLAMPLLLVSILCCRVLYFLVYPEAWQGFGQFFQIWQGGLSFHGAFVGALGTLGYFAWKRRVPFGTICDFVAPGMFLGYAIGRVGCFANGCCYGHPTDVLWACVFPVEGNRALSTLPSHPAQLYSTLMGLGIFGVMWSIRGKPAFNRFPGQLSLLLGAFYAIERFVMEFFRSGATAPEAFGLEWLTLAQLASVVALVVLGALWWALSRRSVRVVRGGDSPHVPAG